MKVVSFSNLLEAQPAHLEWVSQVQSNQHHDINQFSFAGPWSSVPCLEQKHLWKWGYECTADWHIDTPPSKSAIWRTKHRPNRLSALIKIWIIAVAGGRNVVGSLNWNLLIYCGFCNFQVQSWLAVCNLFRLTRITARTCSLIKTESLWLLLINDKWKSSSFCDRLFANALATLPTDAP